MILLLALAFAGPYERGCYAVNSIGSVVKCIEWKQYRRTKKVSKRGLFQMGCRSQLLFQNETDIIEKCNKLTSLRYK